MRVIAGLAKGHHLKAPKGLDTRPTSDKVRGAIFAMLESLLGIGAGTAAEKDEQSPWAGLVVLDLYAGTGALGIEALSRGAAAADFVEFNQSACRIVKENLAHTRLATRARVHCLAVQSFLAKQDRRSYDLVLADPPYAEPDLADLVTVLDSKGLIKEGGWLVLEHAHRKSVPSEIGGLTRVRLRRHGDTDLSIYACRRSKAAEVASGGLPDDNEEV